MPNYARTPDYSRPQTGLLLTRLGLALDTDYSRPQTGLLLTRLGLALDRRAAEMRPGHAAKFVKLIGEQQAYHVESSTSGCHSTSLGYARRGSAMLDPSQSRHKTYVLLYYSG